MSSEVIVVKLALISTPNPCRSCAIPFTYLSYCHRVLMQRLFTSHPRSGIVSRLPASLARLLLHPPWNQHYPLSILLRQHRHLRSQQLKPPKRLRLRLLLRLPSPRRLRHRLLPPLLSPRARQLGRDCSTSGKQTTTAPAQAAGTAAGAFPTASASAPFSFTLTSGSGGQTSSQAVLAPAKNDPHPSSVSAVTQISVVEVQDHSDASADQSGAVPIAVTADNATVLDEQKIKQGGNRLARDKARRAAL